MRVQEKLFDLGMQSGNYEQQIQEVVDKELEVFKALYLPKDGIRYVILWEIISLHLCRKSVKKMANVW